MKKQISLMLFATLLSLSAHAEADIVGDDSCFVISGAKFDHNGALRRLSNAEKTGRYSFAGYQCRIFDSYAALKTYLPNAGIPYDSPIFIIQTAHGGMGGTGQLNGGTLSANQINKEIRDISANYRVAFLNQSCYSGSVLQEKLIWDKAYSQSRSIDRTCYWAKSSPGRVAYDVDSFPKSNQPYTLEEAFSKTAEGIISSAAWSETNMAGFHTAMSQYPGYRFRERSVQQELYPHSVKFIGGLHRVIAENESMVSPRHKAILDNARFVLAPETSDGEVKEVIRMSRSSGVSIANQEPIRQAIFFPPASTDLCTLAVRKFIVSQWYLVFSNTSTNVWYSFQENLQKDMKNYPGLSDACTDLGEGNRTAQDWATWLAPHSPMGALMAGETGKIDNVSSILSKAEVNYSEAPRSLNVDELLQKQEIILSIIGRVILTEESSAMIVPGGYSQMAGNPNVGVKGATGNVLAAFNLSSVKAPYLQDSRDERRRNACRSIQLKAW